MLTSIPIRRLTGARIFGIEVAGAIPEYSKGCLIRKTLIAICGAQLVFNGMLHLPQGSTQTHVYTWLFLSSTNPSQAHSVSHHLA